MTFVGNSDNKESADASSRDRRVRRGTHSRAARGGVDLASQRPRATEVHHGGRPLRRWSASRHRHRGAGRSGGLFSGVRQGFLCGNRAGQRQMRDDSNCRRLLDHADPSRLAERPARRLGGRRRGRGDGRPEWRARARRPVRPSRRPAFGGSQRVRRPAAVSSPPDGSRRGPEPDAPGGTGGNATSGGRPGTGDHRACGQPAGHARYDGCHRVAVKLHSPRHGGDGGLAACCERRFSLIVLRRRGFAGRRLESNAPLAPTSGREDPHSRRSGHSDGHVEACEPDRRARGAHDSSLRRTPQGSRKRLRLPPAVPNDAGRKRRSSAPTLHSMVLVGRLADRSRRCRDPGRYPAARPLWFARPHAYHCLKCRATT